MSTSPEGRQRGFTLIELLIVVAILGILAAVVVPNVGRFLGRGEDEARRAEFHDIGAAVTALQTENNISKIPNPYATNDSPCTAGTKNLKKFPDAASVAGSADKKTDPTGVAYLSTDGPGYVLFTHDIKAADGTSAVTVNYVNFEKTKYCYKIVSDGTITQYNEAGTPQTT